MTEPIKMIEIFSGIGAQEKSTRRMPMPFEVVATMDVDKDAVLSYAAMRYDLEKEMETYEFPSKEQMVSELQAKNLGFDFEKSKHTITMKTNEEKVKQYYIADKLSKNLGDVSLQKSLPYADIVCHTSPCQDYSQAGKGAGGDEGSGTRSSLMFESLRLIETSNPKYVLWENVAAVLSPKHRHNFIKYLEKLSELGYENAFDLLNGKTYGVPQNRLRIFCVSRKIDSNDNKVRNIDDMPKSSNKQVESTMKEIRNNPNIRMWVDYKMPETIPLTTRLKDMLEKNVPEKYYLPDERIEKILNSSFMQEKKRIQMTDVCDTLLARDWKDPKCVPIEEDTSPIRIGNIYGENFGTGYAGNVWDKDGISPTLQTAQGGNRQPLVIDEIKIVGNYMPSGHDASRVVDIDGIAPTVKENHGTVTAIAEPQVIKVGQASSDGSQSGMVYSPNGIFPTLCAGCHGYAMGNILEEQEPFIVASRGRNPNNPSDRTTGAPTEQRLEPNFSGCTNTLTSVQKDNYVCEPQVLRAERTEYGKSIRKQYEAGEVDEKISNMREMKPRTDGVSNTITTVLKDNYVIEPKEEKSLWTETQCKMITEDGNIKRYINSDVVDEFNVGDCADISFPNGYNKANRVFDGYAPAINGTTTQSSFIVKEPIIYDDYNSRVSADQDAINTLTCNCGASAERNGVKIIERVAIVEDQFPGSRDARIYPEYSPTLRQNCGGLKVAKGEIIEKIRWRIRKLMPIECWKLMAFSRGDHNRAAKFVSNSALYKQAGNSIVVNCLTALMCSIFIKDGYKAEVWTKYVPNIND